jgi:integrase
VLYARLRPPEGHLSPKSVREVHLTLRQALQEAVDDGWLARDVALAVRPPAATARPARRVMSAAELDRFWRVADGHRLFALWRLVPYLGGRSGELRALRWEDFDERRGLLVFRRSLVESGDAGRRLREKAPKTVAGTRVLDLSDELIDLLRRHRDWQAQEREWAGERWVDHDLIFASPWGLPLLSGNVLRDFRKLLTRAGVPVAYRLHDLRLTAGSHLLAEGVPLPEVSRPTPAVTAPGPPAVAGPGQWGSTGWGRYHPGGTSGEGAERLARSCSPPRPPISPA